jgi:tetratricopeptide (TPR) repeat protein
MFSKILTNFYLSMILSTGLYVALGADSALAMTSDQIKKVEAASEVRETNAIQLDSTIKWLEELSKNATKDEEVFFSLAQLKFYRAINDDDKKSRIIKYQESIDDSDKAIAINPQSAPANFWRAAAIGKQGLDIGISKALKNAHPMKDNLEIVLKNDERYENAGAHRAMGRLYFELPGWPISFGDNKIALKHLQKAVELAPTSIANHIYLAQVLVKLGQKSEASSELAFVEKQPVNVNHKKETAEYLELARKLRSKL